jgi:hypothetical protein
MTDRPGRPVARLPFGPFLRELWVRGASTFRGPPLRIRNPTPRDHELVDAILRAGRCGYISYAETTPLGEPIFRLTTAGVRWLGRGAVFEEGFA